MTFRYSLSLLVLLASAASAEEEIISCPRVSSIDFSATLEINDPGVARAWNELSGLAASPNQLAPSGAPIMWGHNDGRDQGNFGTNFAAWDPMTGERLMTFMLTFDETSDPPIVNQDWEDMSIGSCGNTYAKNDMCLYFGDVGDNRASQTLNDSTRPFGRPYRLYKVKEPILEEYTMRASKNVAYPTSMVTALEMDYNHPSSPARTANSEGIFIDHTGWGAGGAIGDIYIVTKSRDFGRLYKVPASAWPSGDQKVAFYSPFVVGTNYEDGEFKQFLWTSAEMSWDGTKIIMGTVFRNYLFMRCPGQSVEEAIVGQDACTIWENPEEAADNRNQFEAVAWYPDGNTVLNIAETLTKDPKIVRVSLDYSDPVQHCPFVEYTVAADNNLITCQTVPNPYINVMVTEEGANSFVSETKPDAWCDELLAYFGSPAPSAAASSMPSKMPTNMPTMTAIPTMPPTSPFPSVVPTVEPERASRFPTFSSANTCPTTTSNIMIGTGFLLVLQLLL